MSPSRKNIIFYSKKCQKCSELIRMMKYEGIYDYFYDFCVDGRKDVPEGIKKVPTLIIAKTGEFLVDTAAFQWFSFIKQENIRRKTEYLNAKHRHLFGDPGQKYQDAGRDDVGFTYFDEDPKKVFDEPLPKSLMKLSEVKKDVINYQPIKSEKIDQVTLRRLAGDLEKERAQQDQLTRQHLDRFNDESV